MKLFIKTTVIFSTTLFWSTYIFADPFDTLWTRTFGGSSQDKGASVQQTSDGGYVIAGHTCSFGVGFMDVYLIKTDSLGNTLWTKTYGGINNDEAFSVQQTSDGGYIISGQTYSFTTRSSDVYLIKTYANGNYDWSKVYGGMSDDRGYSVQQTADGGYIIGGKSVNHALLIKTDSLGNDIWIKEYGWSNYTGAYSVQQTSDGGYILGGFHYVPDNYNFYLVKTDANGDTIWTNIYEGLGYDRCYCVRQTSDGGYIAVGTLNEWGKRQFSEVYLIKTTANGDVDWAKTYGRTYDDIGQSVQQTSDGGYIIAGYTFVPETDNFDFYLIKTDVNGDTLWTGIYGGEGVEFASSVWQNTDGSYIVTGFTSSFGAGDVDVYVIKTVRDTIGVEEKNDMFPQRNTHFLEIDQNPFVDRITLKYHLGNSTNNAMLKIYNVSGQLVKHFNLCNSPIDHIVWDGTNNNGIYLPSGVYFVQLVSDPANVTTSNSITKKVVKLR